MYFVIRQAFLGKVPPRWRDKYKKCHGLLRGKTKLIRLPVAVCSVRLHLNSLFSLPQLHLALLIFVLKRSGARLPVSGLDSISEKNTNCLISQKNFS